MVIPSDQPVLNGTVPAPIATPLARLVFRDWGSMTLDDSWVRRRVTSGHCRHRLLRTGIPLRPSRPCV